MCVMGDGIQAHAPLSTPYIHIHVIIYIYMYNYMYVHMCVYTYTHTHNVYVHMLHVCVYIHNTRKPAQILPRQPHLLQLL